MKNCKEVLLVLSLPFLFLVIMACSKVDGIKNYKVQYGTFNTTKQKLIVLRQFDDIANKKFLCVDPVTLETFLLKSSDGEFKALTWDHVKSNFSDTPYIKAIKNASVNASNLQDAGITHALPSERGINLTVDLCPSKKNLDKDIFSNIINEFNKIETPAPIALSVSGLWMNNHQQDLNWIKGLIKENKINVTWINHTYNHKYNKDYPLKENFLLEKGTDLNYEILQNEITMIKNGLTPSVMFRFPGLVSDISVFDKVADYGLIPVGSDAWLAKGENAKNGSIVLIHGNGNEPVGVNDFIKLIHSEGDNIKNKNWLLFDLRESISQENK